MTTIPAPLRQHGPAVEATRVVRRHCRHLPGGVVGVGGPPAPVQGMRGHLFVLACITETTDAFLAPRFVSTLVAVATLIAALSLVL